MRPDWDLYFIRIAKEVASRSTCPRASVGAVITKNNRIIATGYNGAPSGKPHCTDKGCVIIDNHCVSVVHAEANAIYSAYDANLDLKDATLYCWDSKGRYYNTLPEMAKVCPTCYEEVASSGISRVCCRGL